MAGRCTVPFEKIKLECVGLHFANKTNLIRVANIEHVNRSIRRINNNRYLCVNKGDMNMIFP
jgi:hypothetical protein